MIFSVIPLLIMEVRKGVSSMNCKTDEAKDNNTEALWRAEVAKRLEELASGKIKTLSWEEVQSRLHSRRNN